MSSPNGTDADRLPGHLPTRDEVAKGADGIGLTFDQHVMNVVAGLTTVREVPGL